MPGVPQFRKLSVLMPVFNERWTLRVIVDRVLSSPVPLEIELVLVDDCSTDGSWEIIQQLAASEPRIKPVRHTQNGGKGTAIRTAIKEMTGDVAVIQDADLEYDPGDFPSLLAPILSEEADAVFGTRFASGSRRVLGFWHTQVNRGLTLVSNLLTGLAISDMETCYKVVRTDILRQLRLQSSTFTIEPELTARLAQWGARIHEIPIRYSGRSASEGKKIRAIDGVKAIGEMLRCRFLDPRFSHQDELATLKTCDRANACHTYIYSHVSSMIGRRVLHLNGGGGLSRFLLGKDRLVIAESEPVPLEWSRHRFAPRENMVIEEGSLDSAFDLERWKREQFDTIVWTHWTGRGLSSIAAENCYDLLAPGGHCIVITPVLSGLSQLAPQAQLSAAGFEIATIEALGKMPSWLASRLLPRDSAGLATRIRWLDWLLPVVKYTDRCFAGGELLRIVVARKRPALQDRAAA